mgnify:CR=1 FL=1
MIDYEMLQGIKENGLEDSVKGFLFGTIGASVSSYAFNKLYDNLYSPSQTELFMISAMISLFLRRESFETIGACAGFYAGLNIGKFFSRT